MAKTSTTYTSPVRIQNCTVMKCQWRPSPRFLRPGSATTGDQDSSSSRLDQGLRESAPYIFFENRAHSRPGGQLSFQ